jgi:hypothetical protein
MTVLNVEVAVTILSYKVSAEFIIRKVDFFGSHCIMDHGLHILEGVLCSTRTDVRRCLLYVGGIVL